jgi:hypothetical protein
MLRKGRKKEEGEGSENFRTLLLLQKWLRSAGEVLVTSDLKSC